MCEASDAVFKLIMRDRASQSHLLNGFRDHNMLFIHQALAMLSLKLQEKVPEFLKVKEESKSLAQPGEWGKSIQELYDLINQSGVVEMEDLRDAFGSKLTRLVLTVSDRAATSRADGIRLGTHLQEEMTAFQFFKCEFLQDPLSAPYYTDRIPDGTAEGCMMVPWRSEERSSAGMNFDFNIMAGSSPHKVLKEDGGEVVVLIPELQQLFPTEYKHVLLQVKEGKKYRDGGKVRAWIPIVQVWKKQPYVHGSSYYDVKVDFDGCELCTPVVTTAANKRKPVSPFYALKPAIFTRFAWDQGRPQKSKTPELPSSGN